MTSSEIRSRFLAFFKERGHTIIPSASLVPQNDPSVLFNTAGMQPLVPYLLGQPHPGGARLANSQKCVRTVDIDEIGDNTHATFFEMLGNWSLGDYFKEDAIKWSYEFLTSKDKGLGLDPARLYITVFGGNADAPKDEESPAIWGAIFDKADVKGERIYFMTADAKGKEPNWWSAGDSGPCGPDTEMFYDVTGKLTNGMTKEEYMAADLRQDVVEIWNDVFMEYLKKDGKIVGKLPKQNVDTGSGLERVTMVVQGKDNIYETDLLGPMLKILLPEDTANLDNFIQQTLKKSARIVADHMRTAIFLIADGVIPSKSDQGYVLRRLIRRAVRHCELLGNRIPIVDLVESVEQTYKDAYPLNKEHIEQVIFEEEEKFRATLKQGMNKFEKTLNINVHSVIKVAGVVAAKISGKEVFDLYQTDGFPIEMTREIAEERGILIDEIGFEEELKKHRDLSRSGSEQKFKGGLADTSEKTVRLHTAHHLLLRALQIVLGPEVHQRGSNITQERLRIDFAAPRKVTDEEKKEVERIVNEKISEKLPVIRSEMSLEEAEKLGAEHEFGQKYPDRVSVYSVGPKDATPENPQFDKRFSIEFCGGPHVKNTGELSKFRILKEEAVAQGVRRIKAVLE
ncbi:MAG: hypothetical protein A3C93_02935 [Candidatus Lloydbacteria bacterium RIFCSPHIGHO2_02_FULL_54_17]|uniref:Alanine--tRNA ligase n=1 Tax=Candidatus Lloydbacteria bacterium RIFCSPHIGHO2_02_FULL_54_17 TaxID=1798664 RepID=A0A1G2DAK0_9BACT|nr:MAG: hypothetical protein A2762_04805 [Candidatus Lloydbacteria bacterium RIFCSPHIGHO2_01_FULL_54_11]OGZ10659.1 MAG: hypothetical protein A3C93_02935 [Candidatus Lloydbacteria bacterium RIFCSPHIGHO2_02_FULL_54_17]OGZ13694.1 MAG: hypothetical protein A2948_03125 [Candidatus Lloydbacteria bacterium RIFCSPLOWO2_01_FULL_54_18]OGZ16127.1 MAG: hypothetical protein A3H76_01580 [Candidatus Lloydbacteria bacterium RIFCSPLOWO2_02_FULL_54_12]